MIIRIFAQFTNDVDYIKLLKLTIYKVIRNQSDQQKQQSILNLIKNWSDEWLLRLNIDKRKSVSYCIKHSVDTSYHIMDRNQLFSLEKVESMVDLGVRFDSNLTLSDHISGKINEAYSVLGIIKRNFIGIYMD